MTPHAIGWLCMHSRADGLEELAAITGRSAAELFVVHVAHAVAYAFWMGAARFTEFIEFVERIARPHDFIEVHAHPDEHTVNL